MKHKPQAKDLAREIAQSLGDSDSLSLYQSYVQAYPESLLRAILAEVLGVPDYKIKKSRGALFTYLIHKYGGRTHHNHRH